MDALYNMNRYLIDIWLIKTATPIINIDITVTECDQKVKSVTIFRQVLAL